MRWSALLCLWIAAWPSFCRAAEPEVLVELERNLIYEGESVLYRVTLNHVENPTMPTLEGFDAFDVQPRGEQTLDSRQVTIINGRRSETVRYGRAYDFALTPKLAGDLTIPAPTATVDGKTLRGESLVLRVIPPQDQDLAMVAIRTDKTSVFPTQKFTVDLIISVKELPAPLSEKDPVAVLRRNPALSIPWVDDDTLPTGIVPVEPWQRWIGAYVDRGGSGFGINNLRTTSAFSFFGDSQSGFMPPSKRIVRKDGSGKTVGYREYTLSRTFRSTAVGSFKFGPVSLKGSLATRMNPSGRLEGESVFTVAKPVTVTVQDAPEEGRPATYSGAIGQFQWAAELTPTEAKAGDPMTLTLTLSGDGTLDVVPTPDPTQNPSIAEAFKFYEATEESGDNQRRFIYGLRPLKAGIESFPPITFSYFDVDKAQYVDLKTKEIPLRISRAERLAEEDIDVSGGTADAGVGQVETQEGGIFANDSALRSLRDDSVNPVRWFAGLGSLAGVYVLVLLMHKRIRRWTGDPDLVRRRTAAARARRRLQAVAEDGDASQQTDRLQAVFSGLVADALGISEAGLTSDETRAQLRQLGIDDALGARFGQWCEACDAARYGAFPGAVDQLQHEAQALLDEVIQCLKQKRLLR